MTRLAIATCAAVLAVSPAAAQSPGPRVEVGILTCSVAPGVGLIVGSKREMNCVLTRSAGYPDRYVGAITKLGLDIGTTSATTIAWGVLAATDVPVGALAGTYGGVTAEATIGAGVGANVLVGGSGNGIVLQPLSVQAQQGFNIAAGVAALELRPIAP